MARPRSDIPSAARLGLAKALGTPTGVRTQALEARVVGTPGFGPSPKALPGRVSIDSSSLGSGDVGKSVADRLRIGSMAAPSKASPNAPPAAADRMHDSVGSGSIRAQRQAPPASSSMSVVQQLHAEGLMRANRGGDPLANTGQSSQHGGDPLADTRQSSQHGGDSLMNTRQSANLGGDPLVNSRADALVNSRGDPLLNSRQQPRARSPLVTPKAAMPTNSLGAGALTRSPHAQNASGPGMADRLKRNPSAEAADRVPDRVPFARGPGSAASSRPSVDPRRTDPHSSANVPPSRSPARPQSALGAGHIPLMQMSGGSFRVPANPHSGNGASASEPSAMPVPGTAPASAAVYESRLANMESAVKSFDQMLRECAPPADANVLEVMHQCEALACELDEQRKTRQVLEERAKHLDKLLRHERGEREAWLVAFLTSLHTTLQELTVCIDRSIADSNTLMKSSMDGTDEVMHDLIDRVDQLLIQKESELEPLMEQDGELFEAL